MLISIRKTSVLVITLYNIIIPHVKAACIHVYTKQATIEKVLEFPHTCTYIHMSLF